MVYGSVCVCVGVIVYLYIRLCDAPVHVLIGVSCVFVGVYEYSYVTCMHMYKYVRMCISIYVCSYVLSMYILSIYISTIYGHC